MKALKKIPFFLFLLPVFFCLHGAVENYGYMPASGILKTGIFILAGEALLFCLVFLFYRQYLAAALIVFFISLWYLFFGALHDFIKKSDWLSSLKSFSVLLPVLAAVTIVWILVVLKKRKWWPQLTLYLNLLLLLYCMVDIGSLFIKPTRQVFKPAHANVVEDSIKARPNVYFMVMDEYAGYTSLQDSFGFKNDSFYNFLKAKEFEILHVVANYNSTVFSISSTLNMQYINRSGNTKAINQFDYLDRLQEINNAEVFRIFKETGYQIYNYSIFDIDNIPSANVNNSNGIISLHHKLLTDKILHNRASRDIGWVLAEKIRKWLPSLNYGSLTTDIDNNAAAINETRLLAKAYKKTPVFCYTHVMMPHWQYYFDSAGNPNPLNVILSKATITDKSLYLGYLQYTNKVISGLINDIVNADSSAIILLISDHGFRNYNSTSVNQPLHFNNICVVRMPGTESSPFNHSSVNLFPYVFNRGFGQNLPYLKDSSIYIHE